MTRPAEYSRSVRFSPEDEGWIATCGELPAISAFGDSPEEVLHELEIAIHEALEVYQANGWPRPAPNYAEMPDLPSGEFRLRLPRTLHAQLGSRAELEGVSQNSLVTYLLAEGLARTALTQLSRSPPQADVP